MTAQDKSLEEMIEYVRTVMNAGWPRDKFWNVNAEIEAIIQTAIRSVKLEAALKWYAEVLNYRLEYDPHPDSETDQPWMKILDDSGNRAREALKKQST